MKKAPIGGLAGCLAAAWSLASSLHAEDWPMQGGDARRLPQQDRGKPMSIPPIVPVGLVLAAMQLLGLALHADDWPMLGRDQTRNPVNRETGAPVDWNVETGQNVKWRARLGSMNFAAPVVANGLVWIGTNNDNPRDPKQTNAAGVLMCFRERDGQFLYQHLSPARHGALDRQALTGNPNSPLIESGRLWFVTTRSEVVCLDIAPLERGEGLPRELWKLDMIEELGVYPRMAVMGGGGLCSIAGYRDWIYVITGNGTRNDDGKPKNPRATDLVCLNKSTGQVVWEDNSPGLSSFCTSPFSFVLRTPCPSCVTPIVMQPDKLRQRTKSTQNLNSFMAQLLPNAPAHRPRATDARHSTETQSRGSVQPVCSAFRSFSLSRREQQRWNTTEEGGCEVEQNKQTERNDAAPTAGREQVNGSQHPPGEEHERAKIVWQLTAAALSVGEEPKCDAAGQNVGGKNGCDCCKARRRAEAFVQSCCGKAVEQACWSRE